MTLTLRKILGIFAVLIVTLPVSAMADTSDRLAVAHVPVSGIVEPVSAIGLLVSNNGSNQVLQTSTSRNEHGDIVVSFRYPRKLAKLGGTASAMVIDADGHYVFGRVIQLRPNGASSIMSDLPICEKPARSHRVTAQYALLESLVEIRGKRRRLLQAKIDELLGNGLLAQIQKIERGFGLVSEPPLSSQVPPLELIDRMARLVNSVESFQENRDRQRFEQAVAEQSDLSAESDPESIE